MTSTTKARKLLLGSRWFHEASDSLLDALAAKMVPIEAERGHIFIEEGIQKSTRFWSLKKESSFAQNCPSKTRTSKNQEDHARKMTGDKRLQSMKENAIVVDKLEGEGLATGLLYKRPSNRRWTMLESRKTSLFGQFMLSKTITKDLLGTRILDERRTRGPVVLDALKRSSMFGATIVAISFLYLWPSWSASYFLFIPLYHRGYSGPHIKLPAVTINMKHWDRLPGRYVYHHS
jgi:hypothetical protein